MKVVDDILGHTDAGNVVDLVSLDISATFDRVSYATPLLMTLEEDFHITGHTDAGNVVDLVSLDISATFDRVSYATPLLTRLEEDFRITGHILQ